jgi:predicted nucleic acid-binding protein
MLKLVKILTFSNELTLETINLMKKDKNFRDFEDALQYMLAKTIKADFIVTNDKKFYSPEINLITL